MQLSQIPTKLPVPFASGAGPAYRRTVPVPSQVPITPGAASYTDGFPPLNFIPVGAGGIPPFGEDMNGVLYAITLWLQWAQAGGMVRYDATFSAAIGGYPQGAFLQSADGLAFWLSTIDNNVTNPDTGGAGWAAVVVQASNALPLMDGTATVGVSLKYTREDHRHPSDTTRVPMSFLSTNTGVIAAVSGGTVVGHLAKFVDIFGTVGDGGVIPSSALAIIVSTSQSIVPGTYYVDTSAGPVTLTLPAAIGSDVYNFIDAENTWGTNNLTIDGNGHNIGNVPTNVEATFLADVSDYAFSIESNITYWRLV